jgi:flavin-dependent dehydrogenase
MPATLSPAPWDALIIGAGPAGCAAAAILAEHGRRVLLLEREKFPRYHIGESLIPFTFHPLQRLGLVPKMKGSHFVKKYSVQFVAPSGQTSQPFYFFDRYDRDTIAQSWQVLRSEFDQLLLDHARSRGAAVLEETTVLELLRRDGAVVGVRARHRTGEPADYFAPITLDCSGKESFAAARNGWRQRDPYLNKVAVWTYYQGSKRDAGIDEGQTTVAMIPNKGWFWHIPQHDDRVSVGVVAEGSYLTRAAVRSPEAIFQREVAQNPWIQERLATGRQVGPYRLTGEYTHHARHCYSPGLLLAGDAFCFLDPVFSSGVMLALKSGVLAGDAVHAALAAGDCAPGRFADYGATLRAGIENMRKLVYAFYNPNFSFRQVLERQPDLAGDITDCLSGDVNKDFSRLWAAIAEVAEVPASLPYGAPLMAPEPGRA